MSEELLPCPFCGSKDGPFVYVHHRVVCGGCDTEGPSLHDDMETNIAAWNRRATPAHPAGDAIRDAALEEAANLIEFGLAPRKRAGGKVEIGIGAREAIADAIRALRGRTA